MNKSYLYLSFTNFIYLRLKGVVWSCNGLSQPNNIDKNSADTLNWIYQNIEKTKPLVVDCKGIRSITDHAWDELFKSISMLGREVIFINHQMIEEKLIGARMEFCAALKSTQDGVLKIYKISSNSLSLEEIIAEVVAALENNIKDYVKGSFLKFHDNKSHRLHSTPILSTGEYNASYLVSEPIYFYWITLFLLDKLEEMIDDSRIGKLNLPARLLSVSLRAAPFASALGLLAGLQVEIIDHLGPINGYFENDITQNPKIDYIYIGDFTIGGTEIKISRNFIQLRNSELNHALVIGEMFGADVFQDFNLISLVSLKGLHPEAKYSLF